MTPEQLVKSQFEAYNARNLSQFISNYHPEVELFRFPNPTPFLQGMADFEISYQDVFDNSPNLHAELLNRIVFDNKVIDYEKISGRKEVPPFEAVVIYEIENGLIRKVHYIQN